MKALSGMNCAMPGRASRPWAAAGNARSMARGMALQRHGAAHTGWRNTQGEEEHVWKAQSTQHAAWQAEGIVLALEGSAAPQPQHREAFS